MDSQEVLTGLWRRRLKPDVDGGHEVGGKKRNKTLVLLRKRTP